MDPQGLVLHAVTIPAVGEQPPAEFFEPSLAAHALRQREAEGFIESMDAGPIYRFARTVPNPAGGGVLGVVVVGRSVAEQINALALFRNLLLFVGGLAVLVATLGSLFLANRALVPARLAFARQRSFIADASHELRTPLTLIRANAEVLLRRRDRLDRQDAALVNDILEETIHMDRLAANLLTLARLDAGRFHLEFEAVDLSSVAASSVRRLRPLAADKGLTVSEDYTLDAMVGGDREALQQAALILVENAIKYTPQGGRISVRTVEKDGSMELLVEDTGVGIPSKHLARLGQRFYRVDKARSREEGGAGLGLAIAFGIAAAHGGDVHITSTPGKGTTAALTLKSAKHN